MATLPDPVIKTWVMEDICCLSKLPPPPSSAFAESVQVVVGKRDSRTFHIHKGLLTHYSEYFARAFGNLNWLEADGTVHLDEDDPEVFQLFHNFVYTGYVTDNTRLVPGIHYTVVGRPVRLLVEEKAIDCTSELSGDGVELSFSMLVKLAVFADMEGVSTLTDTASSLIMQKVMSEGYIPLSLIEGVTKLLPRGCALRRFLGTTMFFSCNKADFILHQDSLPPTFVADMASTQLTYLDRVRAGDLERPYEVPWVACLLHSECWKKV